MDTKLREGFLPLPGVCKEWRHSADTLQVAGERANDSSIVMPKWFAKAASQANVSPSSWT